MTIQTNTLEFPSKRRALVAATLLLTLSAASFAPKVQATAGEGRWLVRAGVTQIAPKNDNGQLTVGAVTVDSQVGPSLNLAYYFTPYWAVDVLGALPFKHDIAINGANAGSVKHLPPTVTLQYHLLPQARIQPYVGVGINYTLFMDEQLNSGNELELEPSFGLAAQLGVDVPVNARWRVGFDARYVDIDSKVSVDGQGIGQVEIDPIVYSINLGYRF